MRNITRTLRSWRAPSTIGVDTLFWLTVSIMTLFVVFGLASLASASDATIAAANQGITLLLTSISAALAAYGLRLVNKLKNRMHRQPVPVPVRVTRRHE